MKHRMLRINEVVKRELSGIVARELNFQGALVSILQAELARHVTMKYTPHLIFHLDNSIERGARVIEIMQEMEASQGEEK